MSSVASGGTEIEKLTVHKAQKLPGTKRREGCKSCSCFHYLILLVIRLVQNMVCLSNFVIVAV